MKQLVRCESERNLWTSFGSILDGEQPIDIISEGDICLILHEETYFCFASQASAHNKDTLIISPRGIIGWMGDSSNDTFL